MTLADETPVSSQPDTYVLVIIKIVCLFFINVNFQAVRTISVKKRTPRCRNVLICIFLISLSPLKDYSACQAMQVVVISLCLLTPMVFDFPAVHIPGIVLDMPVGQELCKSANIREVVPG